MSSPSRNAKLLEVRIDMMELERSQAAVIATEPTATPCLFDEDLLHAASPLHHGLLSASAASKIASRVTDMLSLSVMGANQAGIGEPCGAGLTGAGPRASPGASCGP
jgi:hypothetical protein